MYNANYEFCDELNAPELCFILDQKWWKIHQAEIIKFLGKDEVEVNVGMLFIHEPADRTYFMLRWPQ